MCLVCPCVDQSSCTLTKIVGLKYIPCTLHIRIIWVHLAYMLLSKLVREEQSLVEGLMWLQLICRDKAQLA
jgi:hypothetical protein